MSWYQAEPRLSLELIAQCDAAEDSPIIDVGGGAPVVVDHLLARGHRRVAVLDLSGNALSHARRRLGAARVAQVEWYEQDVTCFAAPHRFTSGTTAPCFTFSPMPAIAKTTCGPCTGR